MKNLKKINKAKVKTIIRKEGQATIIVTGHKENINSPWVDKTPRTFTDEWEFDRFVEEFTFYRCNSQTGYWPTYYIEDRK